MKMKRFYAHYNTWEAYHAGLYKLGINEAMVENSITLLTDTKLFEETAGEVLNKWPISTKINMTNPSRNKQAWVGQSACCYKYGSNEDSTKEAWNKMNEADKQKANIIADNIILIFNQCQNDI